MELIPVVKMKKYSLISVLGLTLCAAFYVGLKYGKARAEEDCRIFYLRRYDGLCG